MKLIRIRGVVLGVAAESVKKSPCVFRFVSYWCTIRWIPYVKSTQRDYF